MRPLALLQHDDVQRPGFLLQCLSEMGVPSRIFSPQAGDSVPRQAREFSGIVVLGSDASVNDPQRWIRDELALVRDAVHADVPVLGHCFGAQLLAKALGAHVCRNAWANIGWSRLHVAPAGRALLGAEHVVAFNWHYETFEIPSGARRLLYGPHCINKAFSMGKHLAFQCHFEVDEAIIRDWCGASADELAAAVGPAVQARHVILSQMREHLPSLHATARRVYQHWASGLARPLALRAHGGW